MMSLRIALLGIYHESNTFLDELTTLPDFEKGHWLFGDDMILEYKDAHHEIGGMIEVLEREGVELLPVMYAEATPGGIIASETYNHLLQKMMDELERVLPVDGCLVVPHGAAVSEVFRDMDGHWLSLLRERVGGNIPIIGTIDPHANVSSLMVAATDGLVAYKTNPHVDQRQVGKEAADMLIRYLKKAIKPSSFLFQIPLAISIEQQYTGKDPCKSLYDYATQLSKEKDILSVSIVLGFPYADVKEMGSSVIVITDNNEKRALSIGRKIEDYIIENREAFVGVKKDISSVLPLIAESKKPILMLDMGDNVGGGAPGNSTFLLEILERSGNSKCFICLYDPNAVRQAEQYEPGACFKINISNDEDESKQLVINARLVALSEGKFKETDPRHGGQVNFDMGRIAIVQTEKGNTIMLTSLRAFPCSLRQLTAFNIHPKGFDVIIAKGVNAPIAAYEPVCPVIIQVNTPGVTQADMTLFKYKNRRKPLFPFERVW
ncbi:MAG: M81 family metallopeptidase [Chitinophagaceae bacterium]|nr:M81 family metallopeptidase [Chitinophagaceae bacterium]